MTVGENCVLGAAMCQGVDTAAMSEGYGVFATKARNLNPDYTAETVNTEGWGATRKAWEILFPQVVILQCFLHAFIKIRERCKKWGDLFTQIATAVWDAYDAPTKQAFSQRIRRLREWAQETLQEGVVLDKLLALCEKTPLFAQAYDHPSAHRTNNMVDRLMRWQDCYLFSRQYFYRSWQAAELGIRAYKKSCCCKSKQPVVGKLVGGLCERRSLVGVEDLREFIAP